MLKRWFKKTDHEINHIGRNGEYDEQLSSLQEELKEVRGERRAMYYKILDKEKVLVNKHDYVVMHGVKLQDMKDKIRQSKVKVEEDSEDEQPAVSEDQLTTLREAVKKAKN